MTANWPSLRLAWDPGLTDSRAAARGNPLQSAPPSTTCQRTARYDTAAAGERPLPAALTTAPERRAAAAGRCTPWRSRGTLMDGRRRSELLLASEGSDGQTLESGCRRRSAAGALKTSPMGERSRALHGPASPAHWCSPPTGGAAAHEGQSGGRWSMTNKPDCPFSGKPAA